MTNCVRCHKAISVGDMELEDAKGHPECDQCWVKENVDVSEEIREAKEDQALIDRHPSYSKEWYNERQRQGMEG